MADIGISRVLALSPDCIVRGMIFREMQKVLVQQSLKYDCVTPTACMMYAQGQKKVSRMIIQRIFTTIALKPDIYARGQNDSPE